MAPRLLYMMDYQSDIRKGGSNNQGLWKKMPVDIQVGFTDCIPEGVVPRDDACICIPKGLFLPRRVEGRFEVNKKCVSVVIPVPKPDKIKEAVQKMIQCGALCVHVLGEKWNYIPPTLGDFTVKPELVYQMPDVKTHNVKVAGVMKYKSDTLETTVSVAIKYEARPNTLTGATITNEGIAKPGGDFKDCHGDLDEAICVGPITVTPRKLYAVTKQKIGSNGTPKPLVREVPIADPNKLLDCMKKIGDNVACLRYIGETVSYANVLLV